MTRRGLPLPETQPRVGYAVSGAAKPRLRRSILRREGLWAANIPLWGTWQNMGRPPTYERSEGAR